MVCFILYDFVDYYYIIGAQDYIIQPIDVPLWMYAMRNESVSKPDFYPDSFQQVVDNLLESSLGLKQEDISHSNIEDIYLYIVNNIELT